MYELDKIELHVTGTCVKNRLPKELRMNKKQKEYKEMNRGNYKSHFYHYNMVKKQVSKLRRSMG